MLAKAWRSRLMCVGIGFALSTALTLVSGGTPADGGPIQIAAFGDLKARIVDLDRPDVKRALEISKDGMPFLGIFEDASGKIDRFSIINGKDEVAIAKLAGNGITEFAVFGNLVGEHERMPVFVFDASDTPGRWHKVKYVPFRPGQAGLYQAVGEVYQDIDFDGQFDAKLIYTPQNEVVSRWIFLDGSWQEVFRMVDDQMVTKVGDCNADEGTAFIIQGEERTDYQFHPGTGWKLDKKTRVGVKEQFSELSKVKERKQTGEQQVGNLGTATY